MPTRTTLAVAKAALRLSRLLGRGGGTALPGLIAERLQPDLPRRLAAQLPHGVILVTGTNGKTTTTKLLLHMLEAAGERVLSNRAGSNLRRGILSTLIDAARLDGSLDATVGLFEVDEATLPLVAAELDPKAVVVLNLFRDQLDRYGELDTLSKVIGRGLAATRAHLYLNADDPLVAVLASRATVPGEVTFFGVQELPATGRERLHAASDSERCPLCGARLTFQTVFYSHIGHYTCPNDDVRRPEPEVSISSSAAGSLTRQEFTLAVQDRRYPGELALPGVYNLYNAVAASAVAVGLGLPVETILRVLRTTTAAFGRVERITVGSKTLYLLLIKNPAGFTQVVDTFLRDQPSVPTLFAINDNDADGRDVSWLWDVPLEALQSAPPRVITAGLRGADMALRLKYAGIPAEPAGDLSQGLSALLDATPEDGTAYVLPTYTAMLQLRAKLSTMTTVTQVWR